RHPAVPNALPLAKEVPPENQGVGLQNRAFKERRTGPRTPISIAARDRSPTRSEPVSILTSAARGQAGPPGDPPGQDVQDASCATRRPPPLCQSLYRPT